MVRAEDALDDGESETSAFRLSGEEGVEDARDEILRDARAGVLDVERDDGAFFQVFDLGGYFELAAVRHGVGGVDDEIEEGLLELAFVSVDSGVANAGGVFELDL